MFCSNCGKEIADNQKYCSHCGAENGGNSEAITARQRTAVPITADGNGGFNRDVLISYLGNLRTLEMAKNNLLTQKATMEKKISKLGHSVPVFEPSFWDCVTDRWDSLVVYFPMVGLPAAIIVILSSYVFSGPLAEIMNLLAVGSPIALILYNLVAVFTTYGKKKKKYTENLAWAENKMRTERAQKAELEQQFAVLRGELAKANELLNRAYSINVIPTKCRSIYGVYYLYDYLSSSMATLSEALFHFDLEEISKKLDRVIQQQRAQILQTARTNALNQHIIRQNEEMIQRVIAIEENTALAAQYAEVAAVNAETITTIQTARFWYDVVGR